MYFKFCGFFNRSKTKEELNGYGIIYINPHGDVLTSALTDRRVRSYSAAYFTGGVDQASPPRNEGGYIAKRILSTDIPAILQKSSMGKAKGLSLQEIAALGALIEYSTISITAMQNWVKRDFKEYLGAPREGKKYSINQAAILFMIEDLKSSLDFRAFANCFACCF